MNKPAFIHQSRSCRGIYTDRGLRVLVVTNMYPSNESLTNGIFVEQQVKGLLSIGMEARVEFIDRRREGAKVYYLMATRIRRAVSEFRPQVVHVMYGG